MAEYLTVKDAARLMLVSQRTVLRWVQLGRLRPARIGRTLRFERGRLLRQIETYEYGDPSPGGESSRDPCLG